jgi:para-nitrobenzyl esterase
MNRRTFLQAAGGSLALPLLIGRSSAFAGQNPQPGAVVETTLGRVRGLSAPGVTSFKGLRYGASTSGANRFQPPVTPASWTGTIDAFEAGPRAWQPFRPMIPEIGDALTGSGPMDEDCLRLNVWTPAADGNRRPVMVWFHGGGQRTGSGNSIFYDGSELARKHDVVVISVTHRLNALGYLWLAGLPGTGERFARTSNLPLLDLTAALGWVRDNISRFGGNPGNVTIFGQSGGGGKTAMLSAFPSAKGLFHRAIIMSTLADTAITGLEPARAIEAAELFLRRMNLTAATADRLLTVPPAEIISALTGGGGRAGGQSGQAGPTGDISLRYVPVVDGRTLPAHPFDPRASELSADVPMMFGSNECEGIPYGNPDDPYWTTEPTTAAELRERVKRIVSVDDGEADRLIEVYRAGRPNASFGDLATIVAGDNSALRLSAYTLAERKFAQGRAPAYLYYFDWRSPVRNGKLRTMHCMELPFVFDHPDKISFMTGTGSDRAALATTMSNAWVAFARSGNPTPTGQTAWTAFNPATWPTMVFGSRTGLVNDPHGVERRALKAARESRERQRPA